MSWRKLGIQIRNEGNETPVACFVDGMPFAGGILGADGGFSLWQVVESNRPISELHIYTSPPYVLVEKLDRIISLLEARKGGAL